MLDPYVRGVEEQILVLHYSKMIAEKDRVMKKKYLRERERERLIIETTLVRTSHVRLTV